MSRSGNEPGRGDVAATEVAEAVQLLRAAVRETPDGGVDLPYRLDTLGVALTRQVSLTVTRALRTMLSRWLYAPSG